MKLGEVPVKTEKGRLEMRDRTDALSAVQRRLFGKPRRDPALKGEKGRAAQFTAFTIVPRYGSAKAT